MNIEIDPPPTIPWYKNLKVWIILIVIVGLGLAWFASSRADTNLPVVCSNPTAKAIGDCAATAQTFNRATSTTLVRACDVGTCLYAERVWTQFGLLKPTQWVEVCTADKPLGSAATVGGECKGTTTSDWGAMKMVPPAQVASSLPASSSFTISPVEGVSPVTATLTWDIAGAQNCVASNGWTGTKTKTGTQTITGLTKDTTFTLACSGAPVPTKGKATLSWVLPTKNKDGTDVTNLVGVRISYGTAANAMTETIDLTNPVTSYVIDNLPPATYFFAVRVYKADNVQSELSSTVSKYVAGASTTAEVFNQSVSIKVSAPPSIPNPPTNLTVESVIADMSFSPVFGVSSTGTRQQPLLGFVPVGSPCSGSKLFSYRNFSWYNISPSIVLWMRTPPRDNVVAPCHEEKV